MAPAVASAKLTLSYPLYAADFDPQNNGFLLVGGGGGESRSGVGNKIVSHIGKSQSYTHDLVLDSHRHVSEKSDVRAGRYRSLTR